MIAELFEEYKQLSDKLRFMSKLGAFLIAIFTLLSLYDIADFFNHNPQYWEEFIKYKENGLLPALIFQTVIFLIFAARFVLLFFESRKLFGINQCLWILGFGVFAIYFFISNNYKYGLDPAHIGIFRHAARSFDFVGFGYLLLSLPLKFLTLIIAFIKSR